MDGAAIHVHAGPNCAHAAAAAHISENARQSRVNVNASLKAHC